MVSILKRSFEAIAQSDSREVGPWEILGTVFRETKASIESTTPVDSEPVKIWYSEADNCIYLFDENVIIYQGHSYCTSLWDFQRLPTLLPLDILERMDSDVSDGGYLKIEAGQYGSEYADHDLLRLNGKSYHVPALIITESTIQKQIGLHHYLEFLDSLAESGKFKITSAKAHKLLATSGFANSTALVVEENEEYDGGSVTFYNVWFEEVTISIVKGRPVMNIIETGKVQEIIAFPTMDGTINYLKGL